MTNGEAIKELKLMRYNDANTGDMDRALAMAIEALSNSQKHSVSELKTTTGDVSEADVIYRADAIDVLCETITPPSITLDTLVLRIDELPSAQPEGKKGEWIHDGSEWKNRWICSNCGHKWFFDKTEANFCPNCGSHNGSEL